MPPFLFTQNSRMFSLFNFPFQKIPYSFFENIKMTNHYVSFLSLLNSDPLIDEIGFQLLSNEEPFLLQDHKLALHLPLVPLLYTLAKDQLSLYPEEASRVLLLLSSDSYTTWNIRRKLHDIIISEELYFINLVLSKTPKSIDTWAYRRWLLSQNTNEINEKYARNELIFCTKVAERSPRNYHVWSHRLWLVGYGINIHKI